MSVSTGRKFIPIERILVDQGTQSRVAVSQEVLVDYAEALKRGDKFPPIVVFGLEDFSVYWPGDGHKRIQACLRAGKKEILAEVRIGTLEDARWYSLSANKTHGARRSRADVTWAIQLALTHPQSQNMSDAQIARHVGASGKTVAAQRRHLGNSEVNRTGKDGRTINTSGISNSRRRHPELPTVTSPTAESAPPPTPMARLEALNATFSVSFQRLQAVLMEHPDLRQAASIELRGMRVLLHGCLKTIKAAIRPTPEPQVDSDFDSDLDLDDLLLEENQNMVKAAIRPTPELPIDAECISDLGPFLKHNLKTVEAASGSVPEQEVILADHFEEGFGKW